jgi:hypothetical protein
MENKKSKGCSMAQEVEHLPRKFKALSSNPSNAKKKEKIIALFYLNL